MGQERFEKCISLQRCLLEMLTIHTWVAFQNIRFSISADFQELTNFQSSSVAKWLMYMYVPTVKLYWFFGSYSGEIFIIPLIPSTISFVSANDSQIRTYIFSTFSQSFRQIPDVDILVISVWTKKFQYLGTTVTIVRSHGIHLIVIMMIPEGKATTAVIFSP